MIEIQILESKDTSTIGIYKFHKNFITIGNMKGDVLIEDDEILDFHFLLRIINSKLFISLNNLVKESFFVNHISFQGSYEITLNNEISYKNLHFKVLAFSQTKEKNLEDDYKKIKSQAYKLDPLKKIIIEELG